MIDHATGVSLMKAGLAAQMRCHETESACARPSAYFAAAAAAVADGVAAAAAAAAVDGGGSAEHGQSWLLPASVIASFGPAACSQALSLPWGEGVG